MKTIMKKQLVYQLIVSTISFLLFCLHPSEAWLNNAFRSVQVTKKSFHFYDDNNVIARRELFIYEQRNLFELRNVQRKVKEPIIFFTGLNSYISHQYYSNFLKGLAMFPVTIYVIVNQQSSDTTDDVDFFVKKITHMHNNKSINIVAHSSGSQTAFLYAKNQYVKNLILFDPVTNHEIFKKWSNTFRNVQSVSHNKYKYNHVETILIIDMEKSHTITFNPFSLPFIPSILSVSINDLKQFSNTSSIKRLLIKDFGHCDILDDFYGDLMQITRLAVGTNKKEKRRHYRKIMAQLVYSTIVLHENKYQKNTQCLETMSVSNIIDIEKM